MDSSQALRTMVGECGLTHRQLAHRLGREDSYISQAVRRSPSADTLALISRACGYRLALVPIAGGDSIVIGDDTQSDEDAPTIDQVRQLMARSLAVLDQLADQERTD